jgi:AcrR family transcriptional regulator
MARKAVAQELNRDRILDGARELFGSCGYRALTMRSIAKALNYSHGALYYHFKEKAELLYELIVDDFDELHYRQRCHIAEAPYAGISLLRKLMTDFIRFGLEFPRHYEMIFMMDDEELQVYSKAEQARCFELFSSVIKQIIGGKPGMENSAHLNVPWNIFMSLHGFISYNIYYGNRFADVHKIVEDHIHFLCGIVDMSRVETKAKVPMRSHETA